METQNSQRQKNSRIVWMILLLLSAAATLTKIFVGFDIDEAYAAAMPYRLVQGDRLFKDMWEVHQTSSFLPYLFITLFVKLANGAEGLVLFLRCAATVIHLFLSIRVYKTLRNEFESTIALGAAILYYNFLPKWMMTFDFSMQQLWFMTASLLVLYEGERRSKRVLYFAAGILLAAAVLAYPGMLLLYPAYLWVIRYTGRIKETSKQFWQNSLCMTAGCAVMAVLFFGYVLSAMSVSEFMESIPMVFSDGSHQFTFAMKFRLYAGQWLEVLVQSGILLIPSVILTLGYEFIAGRKRSNFFSDFCMMFLAVSSGIVVIANLIGIEWGPFRLQVRYLILFVLAFVYVVRLQKAEDAGKKKRAQGILAFLLVPSVFMFAGILLASNVGPVSSASYLVLADLAFLILYREMNLPDKVSEARQDGAAHAGEGLETWQNRLHTGAALLFLLSLILCKGYYVRVTEYAPSNLTEPRKRLETGAAKGIWVLEEDFVRMEENCDTIRKTVQPQEQYLFMGTEALNNLCRTQDGVRFVSPTTISTPAFNGQWTAYFEQYPDKQPDVIFIAKNTVDDREKFFAKNPFGKWIAKQYDVDNMQETDYLCILRKKT